MFSAFRRFGRRRETAAIAFEHHATERHYQILLRSVGWEALRTSPEPHVLELESELQDEEPLDPTDPQVV